MKIPPSKDTLNKSSCDVSWAFLDLFSQNCLRFHQPRFIQRIPKRLPGFTLMELLLAVAIIAMLLVLAFPAYQGIRRASLKAADLNHIREVGRGLLGWIADANRGQLPYAYVDSNPAKYPVGTDVASLPKNYTYWAGAVFHSGHVSSTDVFFSPLQKVPYWKDPAFIKGLKASKDAWQWAMIGYGASGVVMPYSTDARGVPKGSIAALPRASSIILLADARPNETQSSGGKYDGFHAVRPKRATYPLAVRLDERVTTLFVDGHSAIMSPAELGWDVKEDQWKASMDDTVPPWNAL